LRDASCWSFEVMNGGTGFLLLRFGDKPVSLRLILNEDLVLFQLLIEAAGLDCLLADFEESRVERRRKFRAEVRADGPVFGFDELFDLAFALDDHAQRD
jgi:hypothetical protein